MLPSETMGEKMRDLLWRVLYAAICFVLFWWAFPLFLGVLNVAMPANLMQLMRVVTAALAILYVLFGPSPRAPF